MWEISYKHCLGGGSLIKVLKCKILGLLAAAEVFQVNHVYKHTEEKDAILFSKLQHPNGMQLKGYRVQESPAFHNFRAHEQIIHALCYL
jgi:hypothetical protein